jgi:hypothetical protein
MQAKRNLVDYALILNERDSVATALVDVPKSDYDLASSGTTNVITVTEDIKAGFKVAISRIEPGEKVYKYGYAIGVAKALIRPGDCVHIHNMTSCYSFRGCNGP